jgi:hypothetical protein
MEFFTSFGPHPVFGPAIVTGIILISIWSLIWKGFALWKSAQLSDKWWFIALLLINTAGILDILYIYIFSKKKSEDISSTETRD